MPSDEKIRQLLIEIVIGTDLGKIRWTETANDDEYVAVFKDGKFALRALSYAYIDEDGDRVGGPSIKLYREEDDTLLLQMRAGMNGIIFPQMTSLFNSVRSRALGIDDAIDAVLAELKSDNDVPF